MLKTPSHYTKVWAGGPICSCKWEATRPINVGPILACAGSSFFFFFGGVDGIDLIDGLTGPTGSWEGWVGKRRRAQRLNLMNRWRAGATWESSRGQGS